MSKIGLIIEREYMTRVKKKSFLILTFLTPFLLIALIAVPLLLSMVKDSTVKQIAVADHSGHYVNRMESSNQFHFITAGEDAVTYRQEAMDNEDIYALLVIEGNLSSDSGQVTLYSRKQVEMDLKDFIDRQLQTMARNDKIASYNIPGLEQIIEDSELDISINTIKWEEDGSEKKSSSELAMVIGMICTMVIYIFIFVYGAMVMNGVIEEKTSRIVEIIVSSVKPIELMMGKIIGIALVGLTQVMLWVIIIAGALGIGSAFLGDSLTPEKMSVVSEGITNTQSMNLQGVNTADLTAMTDAGQPTNSELVETLQMISNLNLTELAIWFILFFIGGYLLYASLFAAVGSAIDNQEDAQQFTMPLTIPVLFALYAGIYSASNPDGPLAFWCSMIPFTSPIVMMVRIPFGVPFWELALSFGLLVITFLMTTMIASKIYRTGILMYGKKVTYKELWKWLTYKN
jgi:ABC-2 type transport system permease protein